MDQMKLGVVLGVVVLGCSSDVQALGSSDDEQASCKEVQGSLTQEHTTIARTVGDGRKEGPPTSGSRRSWKAVRTANPRRRSR